MNEKNSNIDHLWEKFKDAFGDYEAPVSHTEINNAWENLSSKLPQHVPSSFVNKLLQVVNTKTIIIASTAAAIIATSLFFLSKFNNSTESSTISELDTSKNAIESIEENISSENNDRSILNPAKQGVKYQKKQKNKNPETDNKESNSSGLYYPDQQSLSKNVVSSEKNIEKTTTQFLLPDVIFKDSVICRGDSLVILVKNCPPDGLIEWYFDNHVYTLEEGINEFPMKNAGGFLTRIIIKTSDTLVQKFQRIFIANPPLINVEILPLTESSYRFVATGCEECTYQWDFGDQQYSNIAITEHQYSSVGNYSVFLKAENNVGCITTYKEKINITTKSQVYIPNSFSPNGDGVNDYYYMHIENADLFELHIFNSRGELVFQTMDSAMKWDGTDQNTGEMLPAGNYFYVLRYRLNNSDKIVTKKGMIRLFK